MPFDSATKKITRDPTKAEGYAVQFKKALSGVGVTSWPPQAAQTEQVTSVATDVISYTELVNECGCMEAAQEAGVLPYLCNTVWWIVTKSVPNKDASATTPADLSAEFAKYSSAEAYYNAMADQSIAPVNACIAGNRYYDELPE